MTHFPSLSLALSLMLLLWLPALVGCSGVDPSPLEPLSEQSALELVGSGSISQLHRTADVLCVPPFGSFDVPGSGGRVRFHPGPARLRIRARGLIPGNAYDIYLMNLDQPGAAPWEAFPDCDLEGFTYMARETADEQGVLLTLLQLDKSAMADGTYHLSAWINQAGAGALLVSDSFELEVSSRVIDAPMHPTAEVLCVPPFGNFDVPGSSGLLTMRRVRGSRQRTFTWTIQGMLPNQLYWFYLMNVNDPGEPGWEEWDEFCNYNDVFVRYGGAFTDFQGNATFQHTIEGDQFAPGNYTLSGWVNVDGAGAALVSDSFRIRVRGGGTGTTPLNVEPHLTPEPH